MADIPLDFFKVSQTVTSMAKHVKLSEDKKAITYPKNFNQLHAGTQSKKVTPDMANMEWVRLVACLAAVHLELHDQGIEVINETFDGIYNDEYLQAVARLKGQDGVLWLLRRARVIEMPAHRPPTVPGVIKVPFSLRLHPRNIEKLKAEAKRSDRSHSDVVDSLIDSHLV